MIPWGDRKGRMRLLLRIWAAVGMMVLVAGESLADSNGAGKPAPVRYVVVFDFSYRGKDEYGKKLADSIRLRLRRHNQFKVIDRFTTAELAPKKPVSLDTPVKEIIALLKDKYAAHIAILGIVEKTGSVVRAEVCCIDISKSAGKPVIWKKAFSDNTERARGIIARKIVESITGKPEWRPPEYGDEPEPKKFGKPLNINGGFDAGKIGWELGPDNVATFLIPDPRPGRRGKVLMINTDIERDAWLKYRRDIMLGKADPNHPPRIGTVANKYATVAGLEGVHYRSDWINASPGRRCWLVADMKGRSILGPISFFPKIFVKGFADFSALADGLSERSLAELHLTPDEFANLPAEKRKALIQADIKKHPERYRREVYRWYLACRNEENEWKHYAAPFPPRGGLPKNVQWLRIEIYAYWPPGKYYFDDVHLYYDPRNPTTLPVEKPRTPHYTPPEPSPLKKE
ncbi:MAG: hypothetical protein J7L99_05135 [Planctomycetes bacterium]|nr:hypothetical protein [Planctomycetota bacterium]